MRNELSARSARSSAQPHFHGKAVLVTGGTKGIGLATGLAFGREGAHVYLTHKWGSADEEEVRRAFAAAGAPEPALIQADASVDEDTVRIFEQIKAAEGQLEVFVSNVCVVQITPDPDSYSKRALMKSLEYSAWPLIAYLQHAKKLLGRLPRYAVGVSSDGPAHFYEGYEMVAVAKAVMETLGRYLVRHLAGEDIRVNMVRTRNVITESALAIHGQDYPEFVRRFGGDAHFVEAEEVGDAILAICSGLLDALNGQVLNVDRGGAFSDNLFRLYHARESLGL
jgi:NAD(P)-dependent dehydrogenase (short-subunit alcohol dehydrogenase family)